ncbi:MAG: glycosyltransferase [Syntrophomonadaceae bacterium]|nr:glycosyltransferase [Syntrophomonadaceae bacterium]
MIGCPVRNRAWVLPYYLQAMNSLNYPREKLQYCFVLNNSTDHSQEILEGFARTNNTAIVICNQEKPKGVQRGYYSFAHLASLRNILLSQFLQSGADYLFSVDSDILVSAHSLSRLIANNCDIVAMLVCNGHQIGDPGIYNILRQVDDRYEYIRDFPRDRVFPVDCTGAAYLIKRGVIAGGVRYSTDGGGEDIGFCQQSREMGFQLYCDGTLEAAHIMHGNQLPFLEL